MSVLDRISLPQKFTILGIFLLLIAAVPTTFYVNTVLDELDFAKREAAGVGPISALQGVIQVSQQHRGVAAGMLGGNEALADRMPGIQAEINQAIEVVDAELEKYTISTQVVSQWTKHKQRLIEIQQAVSSRQLTTPESTAQHTQLIAGLLLVAEDIQDESGLSLDPIAGTYFLMSATMVDAPKLTENMGQMRAVGTGFLAAGELSSDGLAKLSGMYSNVYMYFTELMSNIEKSTNADPMIRASLATGANELKSQIDQTLTMTSQSLIKAQELTLPANEFFEEYTRTINSIYVFNAMATESLVGALNTRVAGLRQSLFLMIGLIVIALAASVLLSIVFVHSITSPMNRAITIANAVASGDLTSHIDTTATNETGQLMRALKEMNDNLVDLIGKVSTGTDSISTASSELATGNVDLSQRTEEQASSLEKTASSMQELNSTVKKNADNSRQANQLAAGASEVAVKGGAVVGQVVQTMNEINESSKKIVDIISVIDGIAFQTNILALNASVEAARAGEQGLGFAVVATEVRMLAQRSAAAAKEIKKLISASVDKVEDGTRLVDEAGSTMDEIVSSVKRVTDIMTEISAASIEQSSGIEQVNQAITQMDSVTQQNAALVEEAAAAAESMQGQAQSLAQAVTVFKLSGGMTPSLSLKINRPNAVAKLPSRGLAKKATVTTIDDALAKTRKVASGGGGDVWEKY